jgi:hypothetical protein
MSLICDVSTSSTLAINSTGIFCGGIPLGAPSSAVTATGTNPHATITVTNVSNAHLFLDHLQILGWETNPILVTNSNLTISIQSSSQISSPFAGIACCGGSNIGFLGARVQI